MQGKSKFWRKPGATVPVLLVLLLFSSPARAVDPVKIQQTGNPENRVDLVFLAEGYTEDQKDLFLQKVKEIVAEWKKISPWRDLFKTLNIFAVPLISKESGADHPSRRISKATALDATYDCYNLQRLLCVDHEKTISAVTDAYPLYDEVIVMVNDPEYGGSGGGITVFSAYWKATRLFFHELGHTYAGLADEYSGSGVFVPDPKIEPPQPNVTIQKERSRIKWNPWIDSTTPIPTPPNTPGLIGLFEGAYYSPTKFYRPKHTCLMRRMSNPMCEVCQEATVLATFDQIPLIDSTLPAAKKLVIPGNRSQRFKVKPVMVPNKHLNIEWIVDDVLRVSGRSGTFKLDAGSLTSGLHKIKARVTYNTPNVKKDEHNLMKESFIWKVRVR